MENEEFYVHVVGTIVSSAGDSKVGSKFHHLARDNKTFLVISFGSRREARDYARAHDAELKFQARGATQGDRIGDLKVGTISRTAMQPRKRA